MHILFTFRVMSSILLAPQTFNLLAVIRTYKKKLLFPHKLYQLISAYGYISLFFFSNMDLLITCMLKVLTLFFLSCRMLICLPVIYQDIRYFSNTTSYIQSSWTLHEVILTFKGNVHTAKDHWYPAY